MDQRYRMSQMIPYETYTREDLEVFRKKTADQINFKKNGILAQQKIQTSPNFGIKLLKHIQPEVKQDIFMNQNLKNQENNTLYKNQIQREIHQKQQKNYSSRKFIRIYSSLNKDINPKDQNKNFKQADKIPDRNDNAYKRQYSQKRNFQQTVKIRQLINLRQLEENKNTIKQEAKHYSPNCEQNSQQRQDKLILLYPQSQSQQLNEWKQQEQRTKLRKNWQNYSFSKQQPTSTNQNNQFHETKDLRHGISQFILEKQEQVQIYKTCHNQQNTKKQEAQQTQQTKKFKQGNNYNRIQKNLTNLENGVKQLSFRIRGLQVGDINLVGYYSNNNQENFRVESAINNKIQYSKYQERNAVKPLQVQFSLTRYMKKNQDFVQQSILKKGNLNNFDDSINSLDIVEQSDIKRSSFYSEQEEDQSMSQMQKNQFLMMNVKCQNNFIESYKGKNLFKMPQQNNNLFEELKSKENQLKKVEISSQMIGSLEVCELRPIVKNQVLASDSKSQNFNYQNIQSQQNNIKDDKEKFKNQVKNNNIVKEQSNLNLQNVQNYVHKKEIQKEKFNGVQKDNSKNQIQNMLPQKISQVNNENQKKAVHLIINSNSENFQKQETKFCQNPLNYELLKLYKKRHFSMIKKQISLPKEDQNNLTHKRKFIKYKVFYQKKQENY